MITVDPADWRAINDLFHAALERRGDDRHAFIATACNGNEALREQVERLVRAHEATGQSLDRPVVDHALQLLSEEGALSAGRLIGRYRLVRELGRGGMGAVYLAARADDEFQQQVAIKLIKRGMDTDAVLRHFRAERQIMAALEHPNIGRLLDGGTTADGLPYFVMEYVDGSRIDQYCDDRHLGVDGRLALFDQVCAAVSYAHQRLIIHRDIKPSNILVTRDGVPKLLDFGIAKFIDAAASADSCATALALRPMTPQYASPEQIQGLRVDALSDVYSLGVLLCELLTGQLPSATDPPMPSGGADRLRARRLPGDLNTIVGTALSRDRARRYQSVDQLSEDLHRYRDGRPIKARRDTFFYRTSKFVRRNRLAVVAGALIFASLIFGIIGTTREALRADRQAAIAQAVAEFLQDDLIGQANSSRQASPTTTADPNLTVRAALDRAAARIGSRFEANPAVEAAIRQTIGDAYHGLGQYAPAQVQMERALELRRRTLGIDHRDTLTTMTRLGSNYTTHGNPVKAAAVLTEVVAGWRRLNGDNHPDTLAALADLALAVRGTGNLARTVALYSDVLRVQLEVLGEAHPDTLAVMNNLAAMYHDQGKFAESEAMTARAIALKRRVLGEEHPSTLTSINQLGVNYRAQGKYTEAEPLLKTLLDARSRVLGTEHRDTLTTRHSLARVYEAAGKPELSLPLFLENLEARRRVLGREHPDTMSSLNMLAESYRRQGRFRDAEPLLEELLTIRRRRLTADHPNVLASMVALAALKREQHELAAAEQYLRDAVSGYERIRPETWQRYYAEALLGTTLLDLKRYEEAEPLLASAYDRLTQRRATIPAEDRPLLDDVTASVIRVYESRGQPEKARLWRDRSSLTAVK
jgi:serine/threonine-protein kinase